MRVGLKLNYKKVMTAEEIYRKITEITDGSFSYREQMQLIARWVEYNFINKNEEIFNVESVDRYWYYCGRNNREFVEITYWVNPLTLERKETVRRESFFPAEEDRMPEWCKSIKAHRVSLDATYY